MNKQQAAERLDRINSLRESFIIRDDDNKWQAYVDTLTGIDCHLSQLDNDMFDYDEEQTEQDTNDLRDLYNEIVLEMADKIKSKQL